MNGKPASSTGASSTAFTSSRARGPATATCAHCSVTEIACTSSSGQRHCAQNSRCAITSPAAAVVVVTQEMPLARAAPRCRRP